MKYKTNKKIYIKKWKSLMWIIWADLLFHFETFYRLKATRANSKYTRKNVEKISFKSIYTHEEYRETLKLCMCIFYFILVLNLVYVLLFLKIFWCSVCFVLLMELKINVESQEGKELKEIVKRNLKADLV